MLQQTTVAAVTPRFERFVARWPTIEALAAAQDEDDPLRMGRPWLLCPRPQPHRLRPRSGERAAASRRPPRELRDAARHRRLYGRGDRRDRVRRARARSSTPMSRASSPGSTRSNSRRRREIARLLLAMTAGRPAGRFRPGDDGSRRDDLPAQGAALRRMPAEQRLRRRSQAARPKPSRPPKPKRRARSGTASPSGSSATARSGWCAAPRRACSAGWRRCPEPNGREAPPAVAGRARHGPPRLHPFRARSPDRAAHPSPSAKAGGSRSTELAEAGLPTLYRRAAELALDANAEDAAPPLEVARSHP